MQFTLVIFSTYEFLRESLANAKSALSFFMSKNVVILIMVALHSQMFKDQGLVKFKNIFLLKELFFISPQLKITLFNTAPIAVSSYILLFRYQIRQHNIFTYKEGN